MTAVLWIRIRIKLKGRIRTRIRTNVKQDPDTLQSAISWIRIRISLHVTSQIVWKMSLFDHLIKVLTFEHLFGN
jgi:hypothetical protein